MSPRSAIALVMCAIALAPASASAQQEGVRRDEEEPPPAPEPQLTKPPRLLQAVAPEYPPAAAAAGLQAAVVVRLDIDDAGLVTRVEVVEPVGNGFDEAAIAAAEQYVFEPAEFDGVPGPITVETTIHFTIEIVEEPEPPPVAAETGADGPASHGGDVAQPVSIAGVALERGTRRRLPGVVVSVVELGVDAITDEDGRFYFHGIPPGSYRVLAVDAEFDRFERRLIIGKGERVDVKLYLRAKGGSPYETVVESDVETLVVTKRTLTRKQLKTVPGTFGDPVRVIQTLPGIARSPFSTGFLLIRGSNPDDSGVYVDGHQVPLLFHFLGGPSFLNAEFLENIHLYPGGFPARYGRAIGGIVAVETRPAKSDGIHGAVDIDLLDAGAYLRFPVGDHGAVSAAGRRSYLNLLLPAFLPDPEEGERLIVTPIYQDYQIRGDYDLERHGTISLFLFGSGDSLDVLSEDSESEESLDLSTSIGFFRLIATYRRDLAGGFRLSMSPAYGRDKVTFTGAQVEDAEDRIAIEITENTFGYRMQVSGDLAPGLRLDAGIDLESRVTKYDLFAPFVEEDFREVGDVNPMSETEVRTVDMLGAALYADLAWDVTDTLKVIPGLRIDGYVLAGQEKANVDPRVVARWNVRKPWVIKGYAGLFTQAPEPEGFDSLFGNPALSLERAIHTGVGAEWRPFDHWLVDAEVYYLRRFDLARFTPEAVMQDDGTLRRLNFVSTAEGSTYGLEVLVRRELTRNAYGWLSYTLSRSQVRDDPEDDYDYTPFDQRHALNAVVSYRLPGGWELGARYQLATGRPQTPVVGATFDADTGAYEEVDGEFRSIRRKTYQQFDVRVEKTWTFDTWFMGVFVDVINVFNIENVEATQYDYRFRDSAPVTSVPIVPSLGVRGQF